MLIVDAHLDLAYNALRGRSVLLPAVDQAPEGDDIPSVGLPDLHAGGVGLICATIFCAPSVNDGPGYRNSEEARIEGLQQIAWYHQQADDGVFEFVRSKADLRKALSLQSEIPNPRSQIPNPKSPPLPAILLLEGADPLRSPTDVAEWFAAGVRIVGLAWRRTRYAGGTGEPGPLSAEAPALIKEFDRLGIIHDASHLAEESFWNLLDQTSGPIMASHSNCRAFVPTDRQLSDEMIRALVTRGGVIGINYFDKFLLRPEVYKTRRANHADVVDHMKRICDLAGSAKHVAIGTDMDGGLGALNIPEEVRTSADLGKLAPALSAAGFSDDDVLGIMGLNWVRYFEKALPG